MESLTRRELEVLTLLSEGLTNREIGQQLCIEAETVKGHNKNIYSKLGAKSRTEAVKQAREFGLLGTADQTVHPPPTDGDILLPPPSPYVGREQELGGQRQIPNPYKGLRAFQQTDAHLFFGRDNLTQRLLDRMMESGEASRFLAVVGPSGSGKSSVVRAGMIPALKQGHVSSSENWFIADMIPGPRPMDELEVALTRVAARPSVDTMAQLARDDHGLHRVAGMLLPDNGELLLVIDQFEEVFILSHDDERRKHFLALLCEAVKHPRSRMRVVITLRADFYDRPLMYPAFAELMRTRMETVLPLTPEELEQAICRPAERVGMTVEPGLVAAMVVEVTEQPGSLPLMQYTLTELFERRQARTLTLATYNAMGGVLGTLTRRADEIYDGLSEPEQEASRQLFLRLVTLGESTEDLRRRVSRSELAKMDIDSRMLDELIHKFADYRLLTMDHDPVTQEAVVEVAHEALIREWGRLRTWLDENRDDIRLQRLLAAATQQWRTMNNDVSCLLSGTRLAQFVEWAQVTTVALTTEERAYLDASIEEQLRQRARRRFVRRLALTITTLSAILMMGLMLLAFDREGSAQEARATSDAYAMAAFEQQQVAIRRANEIQRAVHDSCFFQRFNIREHRRVFHEQGTQGKADPFAGNPDDLRPVGGLVEHTAHSRVIPGWACMIQNQIARAGIDPDPGKLILPGNDAGIQGPKQFEGMQIDVHHTVQLAVSGQRGPHLVAPGDDPLETQGFRQVKDAGRSAPPVVVALVNDLRFADAYQPVGAGPQGPPLCRVQIGEGEGVYVRPNVLWQDMD